MSDQSEQLQLLCDRLAIDDLLTRYTVALDTREWGLLATVFTPDAVIDYTSSHGIRGAFPEVAAWLETTLSSFEMTQHMLGNKLIRLEGDRGTGRTYFFNPNAVTGGSGEPGLLFVGGFYLDRFVRTEQGWRIEERYEETSWMKSDIPLEVLAGRLQQG
jgi:SnoaL-like domain